MLDNIFPVILHDAVQHKKITGNATSAGFFMVTLENGRASVACYGFSQSLGLQPAEGDEKTLERFFNSMGDEI
ncbi:MAG: hypothetical protein WC389_13005 [Lutibacter sp.]|jgi:hypothetical protein